MGIALLTACGMVGKLNPETVVNDRGMAPTAGELEIALEEVDGACGTDEFAITGCGRAGGALPLFCSKGLIKASKASKASASEV